MKASKTKFWNLEFVRTFTVSTLPSWSAGTKNLISIKEIDASSLRWNSTVTSFLPGIFQNIKSKINAHINYYILMEIMITKSFLCDGDNYLLKYWNFFSNIDNHWNNSWQQIYCHFNYNFHKKLLIHKKFCTKCKYITCCCLRNIFQWYFKSWLIVNLKGHHCTWKKCIGNLLFCEMELV